MELSLKNKNVVISGATRGIGRAIADTFAAEGANIAFCSRTESEIKETKASLEKRHITTFGNVVDIADQVALKNWINTAAEKLGGIDIIIANPSAFGIGITEQDWESGFNVDLMATVRSIEYAMPYLEESAHTTGDAAVIIISSAAIAETDSETAYGTYKAGLIHYTKGAARRLAPQGIRVNAVSPGTIYVDDGFWGNAKRNMPDLYQHFYDRNPMKRMGKPQEVANIVAFLASPAASFVTGANMYVDGAWTSRVNY